MGGPRGGGYPAPLRWAATRGWLFAPGAPLGQNRSTAVAACTGAGNIQRNYCHTNYLETSGTTNNVYYGRWDGPSARLRIYYTP